ncbi:hypothetical protein SLS59_004197 [Nothophoma quercina]|uniref:Uncharacterized protein n=1 Tax=Nothophoma quercina TaxID=749835 RepID=A0ABR3RIY4_9PLEO
MMEPARRSTRAKKPSTRAQFIKSLPKAPGIAVPRKVADVPKSDKTGLTLDLRPKPQKKKKKKMLPASLQMEVDRRTVSPEVVSDDTVEEGNVLNISSVVDEEVYEAAMILMRLKQDDVVELVQRIGVAKGSKPLCVLASVACKSGRK